MNLRELEAYLSSLSDKVMGDTAEIVAETATEYFKETFRKRLSTATRGHLQRRLKGVARCSSIRVRCSTAFARW